MGDKLTKAGVVTEAVNTKVTTRQTYVLTGIEGDLVQKDGKLAFIEKDGIDYAPTTVKLPGNFKVPSYRTGLFLDPKGRGTTTGYDQAIALPALQAGGDESLFNENNKKFDVLGGSIEL